jgi:hypothetical protein
MFAQFGPTASDYAEQIGWFLEEEEAHNAYEAKYRCPPASADEIARILPRRSLVFIPPPLRVV